MIIPVILRMYFSMPRLDIFCRDEAANILVYIIRLQSTCITHVFQLNQADVTIQELNYQVRTACMLPVTPRACHVEQTLSLLYLNFIIRSFMVLFSS